jgi:hypothetical protein
MIPVTSNMLSSLVTTRMPSGGLVRSSFNSFMIRRNTAGVTDWITCQLCCIWDPQGLTMTVVVGVFVEVGLETIQGPFSTGHVTSANPIYSGESHGIYLLAELLKPWSSLPQKTQCSRTYGVQIF